MKISDAVNWIFNRPREERLSFVVETFVVPADWAQSLIESLEGLETILKYEESIEVVMEEK